MEDPLHIEEDSFTEFSQINGKNYLSQKTEVKEETSYELTNFGSEDQLLADEMSIKEELKDERIHDTDIYAND